jgi:hypothetical protein
VCKLLGCCHASVHNQSVHTVLLIFICSPRLRSSPNPPFHFSRASYISHHPRGAGLRRVSHQVVSEHGVPWRTAGSRRCIRCRIPTFSAEHASLLTSTSSTTTFSVALHRTWFSSLALTCLLGSTFCPHLHIKR